ncbi:LexA family transcriptional regulator [bacterium]|nr:MAG: LexA family transcriptional regulator [bacterium]
MPNALATSSAVSVLEVAYVFAMSSSRSGVKAFAPRFPRKWIGLSSDEDMLTLCTLEQSRARDVHIIVATLAYVATPGEKIAHLRRTKLPKLSQDELAQKLGDGTTRIKVANYESGRTEVPEGIAKKLSRIWGITWEWFFDEGPVDLVQDAPEPPIAPRKSQFLTPVSEPMGKVKLYAAVSAGTGNAVSIQENEVPVPVEMSRDDYGAMLVDGDSMLPLLQDGDVAVFKDSSEGRIGQIVAASTDDRAEWFVKQLQRGPNGKVVLASLNLGYQDIEDDFDIHGYLVGYFRVEGPERSSRYNPYGLLVKRA